MATRKHKRPLAVVTGASVGIGYELARQFAVQGYDLLLVDEEKGITRAQQQLQRLGTSVESHHCHLAAPRGVESFYKKIQATGRPVAALVVNGGVGVGSESHRGSNLDAELHLIQLNLVSLTHLVRLVLADMVEKGDGKILFTSFLVATDPGPFETVYAASRAFLYSFACSLREEVEGTGVKVSSLFPAASETHFFHRTGVAAKKGFDALMTGKDQVMVGGIAGRVFGTIYRYLPGSLVNVLNRLQIEARPAFPH